VTSHRWFTRSAAVYDVIYEQVLDYDVEARDVLDIVRHRAPAAASLAEFGCGTGLLTSRFAAEIGDVVGSDVSREMLDVLRSKHSDLEVREGDYAEIDLGRTFDAVVCLFASIAYTVTKERLAFAVVNMARHVAPGGVLIADGWVRPGALVDGFMASNHFEGEGIIVDRAAVTRVRGESCVVEMGHLVTTIDGVDAYVERHDLGVFSDEDLAQAFSSAGLVDVEIVDTRLARARCIGAKGR
jgi:SAM-dependent methyltransferase